MDKQMVKMNKEIKVNNEVKIIKLIKINTELINK